MYIWWMSNYVHGCPDEIWTRNGHSLYVLCYMQYESKWQMLEDGLACSNLIPVIICSIDVFSISKLGT